MKSSVIPARLQFQCGHAALVTLPRVKGETPTQRNDRVAREKVAALLRQCDFCAPSSVVVLEPQLATVAVVIEPEVPATLSELVETELELELAAELTVDLAPEIAQVTTEVEEVSEIELAASSAVALFEVAQPQERVEAVLVVEPITPRQPRVRRARKTTPVARRTRVATPVRVASPTRVAAPVASARRYAVRYHAQLVIHAASVQDALRQAVAMGATDVLAITRQD